jgi:hypothetical protein
MFSTGLGFVPFRDEMTRLIEASDSDIFNKSVGIARPEDTFKEVSAAPEPFDLSRFKDLIERTNLDELPITIRSTSRLGTFRKPEARERSFSFRLKQTLKRLDPNAVRRFSLVSLNIDNSTVALK